jgi:hypothetical protein
MWGDCEWAIATFAMSQHQPQEVKNPSEGHGAPVQTLPYREEMAHEQRHECPECRLLQAARF